MTVGAIESVNPENNSCHCVEYSPKNIDTASVMVAFDLSFINMSGKKKSFHTLTKVTIATIDRAGFIKGMLIELYTIINPNVDYTI